MMSAKRNKLPDDFVPGNLFDKYRSGNPVHRWLMDRFLSAVRPLTAKARPQTVLEIGCGPGDLAERLFTGANWPFADVQYTGIDVSAEDVAVARDRLPQFTFREASAYELPFEDRSFDLVVACEVFEHLEHPETAIHEAWRVCRSSLVISVPREPLWRTLNLLRGKYVSRLGNTPGHVQNFSQRAIRSLVETHFEILDQRLPIPWTVMSARRRGQPVCGANREPAGERKKVA